MPECRPQLREAAVDVLAPPLDESVREEHQPAALREIEHRGLEGQPAADAERWRGRDGRWASSAASSRTPSSTTSTPSRAPADHGRRAGSGCDQTPSRSKATTYPTSASPRVRPELGCSTALGSADRTAATVPGASLDVTAADSDFSGALSI